VVFPSGPGNTIEIIPKSPTMLNSVLRLRKNPVIALTAALLIIQLRISAQTFHKAIGMESFEKGNALKSLADGGFIISGESEDPAAQERDMLLMRTDSNGNLLWTKTYGGPERETVNDVLQTRDGGFMMLGEKYQPNKKEGENLTMVKTDKDGNLAWKKIFDEGGIETEGFSMQATPDGGCVVVGMCKNMDMISSAFFSMSSEDQGLYLLKLDANGNKMWSRKFNYGTENVPSTGISLIVAHDGSYMVVGNIAKKGRTDKKIEKPAQQVNMEEVRNLLLAKVKPNGTLVWAREYQGNSVTMGCLVVEKPEGGFMIAGNTNVSATNIDIFLMSLDAHGSVQWSKTYGAAHFESVADMVRTPDGGFVVSGMTHGIENGPTDVLNFKIDKGGNLVWAKTYGGNKEEYPSKMLATGNGITIAGSTSSYNSESFDVLLMKTDKNGNCGNFGKDMKLNVADFQPVSLKIEKPEMRKVEQGILPPNMKKPDVNNIAEHKRVARVKVLGN